MTTKSKAAALLGSLGGKRRAQTQTAAQLKKIASAGAAARWAGHVKTVKPHRRRAAR